MTGKGLVPATDYFLYDVSSWEGSYTLLEEIECEVYDSSFKATGEKAKLDADTELDLYRSVADFVELVDENGKIYHFSVTYDSYGDTLINGVLEDELFDGMMFGVN